MSSLSLACSSAPQRALRCFLVEDSALIRQNLSAALEEMLGATVVGMVDNQAEAVAWAARSDSACDLMVIDIFLKAGSGLEVLRRVRSLRPGLRLVVLSNYATADIRRRCRELGADAVFDKSAELEEMIAYCAAAASTLGPSVPPGQD